jgi:hypothetical protein
MHIGFVLDHAHGAQTVGTWGAGQPQKSFWTGIKSPSQQIPLSAYRCSNCGYVELYARPQSQPTE